MQRKLGEADADGNWHARLSGACTDDKTQVVARTTTGRTAAPQPLLVGQRLVAVSLGVSNLKCATSIGLCLIIINP